MRLLLIYFLSFYCTPFFILFYIKLIWFISICRYITFSFLPVTSRDMACNIYTCIWIYTYVCMYNMGTRLVNKKAHTVASTSSWKPYWSLKTMSLYQSCAILERSALEFRPWLSNQGFCCSFPLLQQNPLRRGPVVTQTGAVERVHFSFWFLFWTLTILNSVPWLTDWWTLCCNSTPEYRRRLCELLQNVSRELRCPG